MVVLICLLLRISDLPLAYYVFHRVNPWPSLPGVLIGSILGSTFLLGVMWKRHMWSRILFVALVAVVVVIFTLSLLRVMDEPTRVEIEPMLVLASGLGGYILASIIVMRSKRISHLLTPPPSGSGH